MVENEDRSSARSGNSTSHRRIPSSLGQRGTTLSLRYVQRDRREISIPRNASGANRVPVVDSMSTPLLINVTPFLSDAQKPLPLWFLSETVFHELMHTYV